MMPLDRPRNSRPGQAGLYYEWVTVARANPAVAAWRWRYELGLLSALVVAFAGLGLEAGLVAIANTAGLLGMLAALFPALRRHLAARFWCIVTPHRVRAGCVHAWIHSRYGKIPVILLTTRQPFGERVYLWCRAGTTASDFVAARELLATACCADDVRVWRGERHAQLVCLDVIRRLREYGPGGPVQGDWTPADDPPAAPTPAAGSPPFDALAA
jgi:hypothetical protein